MATKQESIDLLRELIPAGATVYTVLRHVAASGMSRHISVLIVVNGEIRTVNRLVAKALGYRVSDKTDALIVSGAGMDMGFHVTYSLGLVMYNDGYAFTQRWEA